MRDSSDHSAPVYRTDDVSRVREKGKAKLLDGTVNGQSEGGVSAMPGGKHA